MSNLKRFLALVLAIMMIVSAMAVGSWTVLADDEDAEEVATTEAPAAAARFINASDDIIDQLEILADLGIVKGAWEAEGGSVDFNGTGNVSREQFALFVARIHSAYPEFISEAGGVKPNFKDTDDSDPTYWVAIDYCVEEGIIDGRVPGEIFDPSTNVTFQEAVKMLMTGLGYINLSYPVGYLVRAVEPQIAIFGEHAPYPMNEFVDAPGTYITRNDMAKLLYNYLMSSKWFIEAAQTLGGGIVEWREILFPVLEQFGISKTTGYVTGSQGYIAELQVVGVNSDFNLFKTYTVIPLVEGWRVDLPLGQSTWTDYRYDTIVSWVDSFPVTTEIPVSDRTNYDPGDVFVGTDGISYYKAVNHMAREVCVELNKADIGLADVDPADLIGLKIEFYTDNRLNKNRITIPTNILGKKASVDITKSSAEISGDAGNRLASKLSIENPWTKEQMVYFQNGKPLPKSLTDDNKAKAVTHITDLEQRHIMGAARGDLDTKGVKLLTSMGTFSSTNVKTTAGFYAESEWSKKFYEDIGGQKYYTLEYVDNGIGHDGLKDFYFVYTAFEAGVKVADYNGDKPTEGWARNIRGTDYAISAGTFKNLDGSAATVENGEAYVYAIKGNEVYIYEKLEKTLDAAVISKVGSSIGFNVAGSPLVKQIGITGNKTRDDNIKPFGTLYDVNASGIDLEVIGNKNVLYTSPVDGDKLYLIRDVTPDAAKSKFENSKYALALALISNNHLMPVVVGDPYVTFAAMVEVFNEKGQKQIVWISDVISDISQLDQNTEADRKARREYALGLFSLENNVSSIDTTQTFQDGNGSLYVGEPLRLVDNGNGSYTAYTQDAYGAAASNGFVNAFGRKSDDPFTREYSFGGVKANKQERIAQIGTLGGWITGTYVINDQIRNTATDPRAWLSASVNKDTIVLIYNRAAGAKQELVRIPASTLRETVAAYDMEDLVVVATANGDPAAYMGMATYIFIVVDDIAFEAIETVDETYKVMDGSHTGAYVVGSDIWYIGTAKDGTKVAQKNSNSLFVKDNIVRLGNATTIGDVEYYVISAASGDKLWAGEKYNLNGAAGALAGKLNNTPNILSVKDDTNRINIYAGIALSYEPSNATMTLLSMDQVSDWATLGLGNALTNINVRVSTIDVGYAGGAYTTSNYKITGDTGYKNIDRNDAAYNPLANPAIISFAVIYTNSANQVLFVNVIKATFSDDALDAWNDLKASADAAKAWLKLYEDAMTSSLVGLDLAALIALRDELDDAFYDYAALTAEEQALTGFDLADLIARYDAVDDAIAAASVTAWADEANVIIVAAGLIGNNLNAGARAMAMALLNDAEANDPANATIKADLEVIVADAWGIAFGDDMAATITAMTPAQLNALALRVAAAEAEYNLLTTATKALLTGIAATDFDDMLIAIEAQLWLIASDFALTEAIVSIAAPGAIGDLEALANAIDAAQAAYLLLSTDAQALVAAQIAALNTKEPLVESALIAADWFDAYEATMATANADIIADQSNKTNLEAIVAAITAAQAAYPTNAGAQALIVAEDPALDDFAANLALANMFIDGIVAAEVSAFNTTYVVAFFATNSVAAINSSNVSTFGALASAVAAVRADYDALSAEAKADAGLNMPAGYLANVEAAIAAKAPLIALAEAFLADPVNAATLAIATGTVTLADEAAIVALRAAYNALNGAVKACFEAATEAKITDLETEFETLVYSTDNSDIFAIAAGGEDFGALMYVSFVAFDAAHIGVFANAAALEAALTDALADYNALSAAAQIVVDTACAGVSGDFGADLAAAIIVASGW